LDAEARWVDFKLRQLSGEQRLLVQTMTNESLEDEIERLNDEAHGGEGYENYTIIGEHPIPVGRTFYVDTTLNEKIRVTAFRRGITQNELIVEAIIKALGSNAS
jgi:hypothetical protein